MKKSEATNGQLTKKKAEAEAEEEEWDKTQKEESEEKKRELGAEEGRRGRGVDDDVYRAVSASQNQRGWIDLDLNPRSRLGQRQLFIGYTTRRVTTPKYPGQQTQTFIVLFLSYSGIDLTLL